MRKKTAIIILNWNGLHFLNDCLSALKQQTEQNFDVYLVDNGSTDGSVAFLQHNFPNIHLIELDHNTGFAQGNNVGIVEALKDRTIHYVVTLNNDTVVEPNFLSALLDVVESDATIGCVAAKIKFIDDPTVIDTIGIAIHPDGSGLNRGSRKKDIGQYDKSEEVFGASAGAALYRRSLLEDIELNGEYFDSTFFAYYEDVDVAWRARLRGWKCYTAPQAVVLHVHSGTTKAHSPFKSFHMNRNRFFVIIKDYSFSYAIKALMRVPWRYAMLVAGLLRKKGDAHALSQNSSASAPFMIVLKAWRDVLRYTPQMLHKRFIIQRNRTVSSRTIQEWFESFGQQ